MLRRMPKTRFPMDMRPIKQCLTVEEISNRYGIKSATIYKYRRECPRFPKLYQRMTNKLRVFTFLESDFEFWYENVYLKYYQNKKVDKDLI